MKTYKIISALSLVLIMGLSSCDEFLTKQPALSQTNDLSLSTFDGINKALIGSYSPLYSTGWYGRDFIVTCEIKSGNAKSSPMNSGRFKTEYLWNNTPTATSGLWSVSYNLIARVNNIINACNGFSEPGVTQADINAAVGEAKFLRALAYHDLVRMFAQGYYPTYKDSMGVPVVLVSEIMGKPARKTVAEVYTQILADLKDAEDYLPTATVHVGDDSKAWATKLAAQALTARVYLYKGDWQKAADYASLVINDGSFELFAPEDYTIYQANPTGDASVNGVWGAITGGSEVIFEVYGAESNSSHGNWDVISYIMSPEGYGDVGASNDVKSLFTDATDVRGKLFRTGPDYPTDFWSLKYPGKNGNLREDNIPVLRLSEMYLIRCEAILKGAVVSGETALGDINAIRAKRLASPLVAVTLPVLYQERRRELCYEGHELFDLARTNRDLTRVDFAGAENQDVPAGYYKWAMPIPQDEIDTNPNCKQNPGYGSN